MADLNRFKEWLYRKRTIIRLEGDRAERRQKKEQEDNFATWVVPMKQNKSVPEFDPRDTAKKNHPEPLSYFYCS